MSSKEFEISYDNALARLADGLLSDKKASQIAKENEIFKKSWLNAGCTLAYMGFNLLTLSVIPNFRLTNKGLIDVNSMSIVPLFE